MTFKIDDQVNHIIHGQNFKVVATKDNPLLRERFSPVRVPNGYDYLIVSNHYIENQTNNFIPCLEIDLEPII